MTAVTELKQVMGKSKGRSGSLNYVDADVQAVHERFGIPYQVESAYSLAVALNHSKYGVQIVEFDNGAICFGCINSSNDIPAHQTINAIKRMSGVKNAMFMEAK